MLRYYPSSKVLTDQNTSGGEFSIDGKSYKGKYYVTYDGKYYSGKSPETGPSKLLTKGVPVYSEVPINRVNLELLDQEQVIKKNSSQFSSGTSKNRIPGKPNTHYPQPTPNDYRRGYIIRYFIKKENQKGFITEISQEEYNSVVNGRADYDTSLYQTAKILWKLTGPLRSQRQSQYNIIPGIIDTNQRLTETTNKTFLGITEFIGGEYDKFARSTA